MKLARYRHKGKEHYGALQGQNVICLPLLAKLSGKNLPLKLENFIASTPKCLLMAENLLSEAQNVNVKNVSTPTSEVVFLPPIGFPPKIICLGRNYVDHASELKESVPDEPIIFMKPHTTIIGPGQKIVKPSFVKQLDYEGELAIVMGKKAKNVPVAEAKSYIFGYTILNDVSARDFQFKDKQWTRGKSFDTFAPIGPSITTENQLSDTSNLSIRTWVNGELRQNATTRGMFFNVSQIVYHLSRVITLEPCDIIATGTPAGVGFAMKPQKFLKPGDVVRIEIQGIGILENAVVENGPTK